MLRGFGHTLFYLLELGILVSGGAALWLHPEAWRAILVCVVGASIASVLCERVARRYLRGTLGVLRRVADDLGHGRISSTPLEAQPGDDFYKLVSAINLVAARLADASQQQRRLHDELRRRERLAFLGELAASVAHEINNPLDGVQNCLRILRRSDDPRRERQMLELMESGLLRIEMIIRRLLTLARENVIRAAPASVAGVVERALEAVREKLASAGVRVTRDFTAQPDLAPLDPQLLEQVFVNLFLNAMDSMASGGELHISIRRADAPSPAADPEPLLHVAVRDSGAGVTPELLPHIFEPFVTTKRDGKGTGLGLAIAARIIDAHHGSLIAEPNEGAPGMTFHVRLPAAAVSSPARDTSPEAPVAAHV